MNTELSPEDCAAFSKLQQKGNEYMAKLPVIRIKGLEALKRLLKIAQRDTGQSGVIARFLLGLYNDTRFPFDLTDFRRLDEEIFKDCLAVLEMDACAEKEVHEYFENGGQIWEKLADDWNVTDCLKLKSSR